MKIGIVSDSHNHLDNLLAVRRKLMEKEVGAIIHLGDNYDDAPAIKIPKVRLLRVPGIFSHYYRDPRIPNRIVEEFSDWKVLLTHAPTSHENDLPEDKSPEDIITEEKIDLVLYGHTHIPCIEEKGNILWVNPGHLKAEDRKGYPPTYALMELEENRVEVRIINLIKDEEIFTRTFKKSF